jgi:GxxExxY protein
MNANQYDRSSKQNYNFADGSGAILRAASEVQAVLGPGFQEVVYQRALAKELLALGVEFAREENVPIFYKGEHIDTRRVDFVVGDIIVELKARTELADQDIIQTLSYLKASGYKAALLINFGGKKLEVRRFVNGRGVCAVEPRQARHRPTDATKAGYSD